MQTCPFCHFDAGDRPLNEGRCPQCGSIIQWSDEDIAATIQNFQAHAEQNQEESSTADQDPISAQPDSASDSEPTARMDAEPSSLPAQPMSDQSNPDADEAIDERHPTPTPVLLSRLWKDSIAANGDVRSTLKGEEAEVTVSDTVFSIQTREVRLVSDSPSESLDYELLEVIGQGGVGVVYSARQASIDRHVALKMLREEYRNREDHRDKFLAEAVLTGELDHPNIVPIYDLGRSHSGELFYSMKNVNGTPWDRVLTSKSLDENLDILLKVADAIAFAHSRGVIHRDLKPENVMLGSYGEVLVMDWGIALPTAEFRKSASILRSQAMGGTPAYMAPEMAKGPLNTIGPASDVYLLGAILFEILTGYPPHFGKNVMDCVANAAKNIIRTTSVTGELMDIANKAMATLPRRRYRQVQDLQAAIRLYQAHSESISLSDNAEQELAEGLQSQDYQKFSRAVFAFQESLTLWPENTLAQSGLLRAKIAYATTALDKGDYDLGLSLLEPNQPEQLRLIDKLRAAIRERETRQGRLRTLRRAAVAMVAFILIAGGVALTTIWEFYKGAKKSQTEARMEKEKAEKNEKDAVDARIAADGERREAVLARHKTELARFESLADRRRAEESAYLAETGLIGASVAQNNFAIARSILQLQAESNAKSNLRHWEWGRFQFLVQGGGANSVAPSVDTHSIEETVESVDCLPDGSLFAIGLGNGQCQLWRASDRRATQWECGRLVSALDLADTGQLLVTCGLDENREGCVRVWQLNDAQPPKLLKQRAMDRPPTSVSFCHAPGSPKIVISESKNVARLWSWQSSDADVILLGHNAGITQGRYSPDDRWVATASADGTVRLFDAMSGKETQRFSGHTGTVSCLAFSPDGQSIASGGEDKQILIWPVETNAGPAQQIEKTRLEVAGQATPEPNFIVLRAHTGAIRGLGFSRDGSRLASGATDNLVCVWRLAEPTMANDNPRSESPATMLLRRATGENNQPVDVPVTKLRGHGSWVHTCVFAQDGKQVLSGADDNSWKIWQVDQYQEQLILGNGQLAIGDANITPDGKTIVLAMSDGTIQLWDRATGKVIDSLAQGHDYLTNRAVFVDNGQRLITAAGDNTLRLWDVTRGNQIRVIEHSGRNAAFNISPDGRWLIATGDEQGVAVCDLTTNASPARFRASTTRPVTTEAALPSTNFVEPTCAAISDDGHYFVVADNMGRCEFWDRITGKKLHSLAGHAESVVAVFAMPTSSAAESIFMTASADGTVAQWNAVDGKELSGDRWLHRAPLNLAVLSPDRKSLVTAAMLGNGKGRIWLWDVTKGAAVATYDLTGKSIQDLAFRKFQSASEVEVIATTSDLKNSNKEIWSWQPAANRFQAIQRPEWLSASTWGTAIGSDVDSILIFGGRGARLWRWQDKRPVMQYRPSAAVTAVALSTDGKWLAAGNDDGSIVLWDMASRAPHETFVRAHGARINDLAFSHGSQHLASVDSDGLISLRNLTTGDVVVRRTSDKSNSLNSVAFSPDGTHIAITADDDMVRIHTTDTLEQKYKLTGHSGRVCCAQFSPDQQWLASGGEDKSIHIWSLRDGSFVTKLLGHSADVTSLDFSKDGLRLLSGSRDTTCKIWDISRLSQLDPADAAFDQVNSASNLGELLTLEKHTSDVVLAQFSPDGSEILTAGKEGQAIIWPACKVAVALRLTKPSVDYRIGSGLHALDHRAIISQTDVLDVRNATLRIKLLPEDVNANPSELPDDFKDSIVLDTSSGLFEGNGESILWKPTQQTVALLKRTSDEELEIQFGPMITHDVAQKIVRHLHYEASSSKVEAAAQHTRTYEFELRNATGESGNSEPEVLIVNLIDPKNEPVEPGNSVAGKRRPQKRSSTKSAALNHVQSIGH